MLNVKVRNVDHRGFHEDINLTITNMTKVKDLQHLISGSLKTSNISNHKLYFAGKELLAEDRIRTYDIKNNDVILLFVQHNTPNIEPRLEQVSSEQHELSVQVQSKYYQIGDLIDVIYKELGAWFEAKIVDILIKDNYVSSEENLIFKVVMDRSEKTAPILVRFSDIRPRSTYVYDRSEIQPGMIVLVNFNIKTPLERGYWYDCKITKVTADNLEGILLMGQYHENIHNCLIQFKDEVMRIESPTLISERNRIQSEVAVGQRKLPLYCDKCKDISKKNCKECGCNICGKKSDSDILIICDECDLTFHIYCLDPPLASIPVEPEWYCMYCKINEAEIVKPGMKSKLNTDRLNTKSCIGDIFGPIPGTKVGDFWESRIKVFESGVHKNLNSDIHGNENHGVYSLLLSDKNKDIVDSGEEFYYTISTGYRPSDNGRMNLKRLRDCFSRTNQSFLENFSNIQGKDAFGKAENWKSGKPIRVVRSYKLKTFSKFAPESGNRYDGIYKVVEYFPDVGQSGRIIFRYLLRRDDLLSSPWTKYHF